jgi:tetratricopeptide (TPR) repeat protein
MHDAAVAAAGRAVAVSPYSPRAYLISARVRAYGGDYAGALADITRGLSIQFDEPGLLALRGSLRAARGEHRGALADFDSAIAWGAVDRVHEEKASTLVALGRLDEAVQEWSAALRRDPELPAAYLGRAQSFVRLRQWDMALADLEKAAAWAQSDPWLELKIVFTYFQCLAHRADRRPRWVALALRVARDAWALLAPRTAPRDRSS